MKLAAHGIMTLTCVQRCGRARRPAPMHPRRERRQGEQRKLSLPAPCRAPTDRNPAFPAVSRRQFYDVRPISAGRHANVRKPGAQPIRTPAESLLVGGHRRALCSNALSRQQAHSRNANAPRSSQPGSVHVGLRKLRLPLRRRSSGSECRRRSDGNRCRRVSRLDLEHCAVLVVGRHVEEDIRSHFHVANATAEFSKH